MHPLHHPHLRLHWGPAPPQKQDADAVVDISLGGRAQAGGEVGGRASLWAPVGWGGVYAAGMRLSWPLQVVLGLVLGGAIILLDHAWSGAALPALSVAIAAQFAWMWRQGHQAEVRRGLMALLVLGLLGLVLFKGADYLEATRRF